MSRLSVADVRDILNVRYDVALALTRGEPVDESQGRIEQRYRRLLAVVGELAVTPSQAGLRPPSQDVRAQIAEDRAAKAARVAQLRAQYRQRLGG